MADSPVLVINDYRGVRTQERTRSSGKKTVTLSISAEPIAVNLDRKELARPAADAYVADLQQQIAAIAFRAAPATLAKRKVEEAAFRRGEAWAVKEFGGGRMGAMPPNQTEKLFNNSGRLSAGITSNWSSQEQAWIVRFPANRFAPEFLAQTGGQAILDRLVDMVPALRNPMTDGVLEAIDEGHRRMLVKLRNERDIERMRTVVNVLEFVARVAAA